jgi:hypothetical protein
MCGSQLLYRTNSSKHIRIKSDLIKNIIYQKKVFGIESVKISRISYTAVTSNISSTSFTKECLGDHAYICWRSILHLCFALLLSLPLSTCSGKSFIYFYRGFKKLKSLRVRGSEGLRALGSAGHKSSPPRSRDGYNRTHCCQYGWTDDDDRRKWFCTLASALRLKTLIVQC